MRYWRNYVILSVFLGDSRFSTRFHTTRKKQKEYRSATQYWRNYVSILAVFLGDSTDKVLGIRKESVILKQKRILIG